ncbi:PAN domain-containing protein [Pyxidicoccus trucidator]|uniref:PAN domain-containing protein n=1 Tax=Pyxidicoccus trucidator TaxID=2709662 RepID=UPI0013DA8A04|nr:PAN domain-containing protein [Pyxidicoccus trucidator]
MGDAVYSIWGNPLDTPTPSQYDVRFYSRGVVTSTTGYGTFTTDPASVGTNPTTGQPDFSTSHERPIAISTDLWGNYGASGSGQLSATTHRLVVGPLSTISTGDGRGRHALSMAQYLLDGTVDPRDTLQPRIHATHISALGLTPANYGGRLDKDGNKLIDLQEDLEKLRGENARGWYTLEFESERRNALWTKGSAAVTFDTGARTVRIVKGLPGHATVLSHQRLNLTPGTWRLSMMMDLTSSSWSDPLWFGLRWTDAATGTVTSQGRWPVSPVGSGWKMHAVEVTVPSTATGIQLFFDSDVPFDARLGAVNVVRAGTVMDLDSADTRFHWKNDVNGARGRVVPRGVSSTTRTDWAVRVQYDPASPAGWPIRNRQLVLLGGKRYRLCFDYRQESAGMGGVMRVLSTGAERVRHTFTPTSTWQRTCTPNFKVTTDDNNVQFGVSAGTGSYLVDNLTIEPQRGFVSEPGIDRPGSDLANFDLPATDPLLCEDACANNSACVAYTYVAPGQQGALPRCWLKNAVPAPYPLSTCHSGYLQ